MIDFDALLREGGFDPDTRLTWSHDTLFYYNNKEITGIEDAMPQSKDIQIFKVQPGAALDELHHKPGQGPEHQQGACGAQGQHDHTEGKYGDGQRHAEVQQDGVGGGDTGNPQYELEHRHPQGTGL